MQDARDPKTIAEKAKPLAEHRRPTKEEEEDKGSMSTINGRQDSSYLTARIARDCPAILEEMKAGKYPSVRAAAKAARVLKEAARLNVLKRAWGKASHEERDWFLEWREE
jgi:hypothetical protein